MGMCLLKVDFYVPRYHPNVEKRVMKAFHERHTRILLLGMTVLSTCTLMPAAVAQDIERNKNPSPGAPHARPGVRSTNTHVASSHP